MAEGAWARAGNFLQRLSQQQIIDCAIGQYTNGCNGGNVAIALGLIQTAGGFCSAAVYPFAGGQTPCAQWYALSVLCVVVSCAMY